TGVGATGREISQRREKQTILRRDGCRCDDLKVAHTASRVDDPDVAHIIDQLEEVTIARDDIDSHRRSSCKRAYDVVGFMRRDTDDRDAECRERFADERPLSLGGVGDLLDIWTGGYHFDDAVCFIARDEVDTPLWSPVVVPAGDDVR